MVSYIDHRVACQSHTPSCPQGMLSYPPGHVLLRVSSSLPWPPIQGGLSPLRRVQLHHLHSLSVALHKAKRDNMTFFSPCEVKGPPYTSYNVLFIHLVLYRLPSYIPRVLWCEHDELPVWMFLRLLDHQVQTDLSIAVNPTPSYSTPIFQTLRHQPNCLGLSTLSNVGLDFQFSASANHY